MKNKAGKFVTPGLRGISAAAATIDKVPASNEMHIVDPPKSQKNAYPICTFSYVLVHKKTPNAPALRKFVFYALTQGQAFGPKLLYGKIPNVVLFKAEKTLKQIHS
jgi:phosphate transport system substrate-binding protein